MANLSDILDAKKALRARMKAWRAGLSADAQVRAAEAVAQRGLDFLDPQPPRGSIVSGFSPIADEFRVWPLLFRAWTPGDAMDKAVWNIAEPKPDKPALDPDILIVPLLAFDRAGWRLGYGGGFYDRTLRDLRARKAIVAVGLAFDEQQVDAVPHLDYDERLDWVLRPSGPLRCES